MGQKGTISRRRTAVVSCANYGNLAIDEDFRRRKWPLMAKKTTFSIFQTSPNRGQAMRGVPPRPEPSPLRPVEHTCDKDFPLPLLLILLAAVSPHMNQSKWQGRCCPWGLRSLSLGGQVEAGVCLLGDLCYNGKANGDGGAGLG